MHKRGIIQYPKELTAYIAGAQHHPQSSIVQTALPGVPSESTPCVARYRTGTFLKQFKERMTIALGGRSAIDVASSYHS